jgi:Cu+-exporting ATPase
MYITTPTGGVPALVMMKEGNPAMAEQLKLSIGGMTCAACSARVERGLSKTEGIESATDNLPKSRVSAMKRIY